MGSIIYCDKCEKREKPEEHHLYSQVMMLGKFNWHFCPECTEELKTRISDFVKKDTKK